MKALGGREGCQNDPREMLNDPPGGMSPENFSFPRKSRLHNGFYEMCFPLVFGAEQIVVYNVFVRRLL